MKPQNIFNLTITPETMYTSSYTRLTALLLLLVFDWTGCDTVDPAPETTEAPAAVPTQAFDLDVNFFSQDAPANKNGQASHFLAAVWRVTIANLVAGSILYYPAVATHAIQEVEPVFNGGAFVWAADTLVDGRKHGIELRARMAGTYVDWTMRISGIDDETGNDLEDFVLYTAQMGTQSSNGTFAVFFPINGVSRQVMDGAYDVVSETESTLSFSIPEGIEDIGGVSAVYGTDGIWTTLKLTGAEGKTHFMEWNSETHESAITATDYFNGEKGCWDSNLLNTECAPS